MTSLSVYERTRVMYVMGLFVRDIMGIMRREAGEKRTRTIINAPEQT